MTAWGDKLYIWGGRDTQDRDPQFYNDLWEYHPAIGRWTWPAAKPSRCPRSTFGALRYGLGPDWRPLVHLWRLWTRRRFSPRGSQRPAAQRPVVFSISPGAGGSASSPTTARKPTPQGPPAPACAACPAWSPGETRSTSLGAWTWPAARITTAPSSDSTTCGWAGRHPNPQQAKGRMSDETAVSDPTCKIQLEASRAGRFRTDH